LDTLKLRIKHLIVEALHFEDVVPEEISDESPLFGDDSPLGLDSIDAIELVVEIERRFEVQLKDDDESRKLLYSVNTLADWLSPQLQ
jgi:acyl carrier protein